MKMAYNSVSKQYRSVEYYIVHTAIPKKLGRVIYDDHNEYSSGIRKIIELIKRNGLTPIPIATYRRMQAEQAGRK